MGKNFLERGIASLRENGYRETFRKIHRKITGFNTRALPYEKWRKKHHPSRRDLKEEKQHCFAFMPSFTVLVCIREASSAPVPDPSIAGQFRQDIEVLFYNENAGAFRKILKKAAGEYVVLSDQEECYTPDAFFCFAAAINDHPDAVLLYADEDRISGKSHFSDPVFKPDLSPHYLLCTNYAGHPLVLKKSVAEELLEEIGEWSCVYSLEYALLLSCLYRYRHKIYHIPKVLSHRPAGRDFSAPQAEGADLIRWYYRKNHIAVEVEKTAYPGVWRTRFMRPYDPLVSVIIPTKDHREELKRCIDSIEEKTLYRNFEYILIENNSEEADTFVFYKKLLKENKRVKLIEYKGSFNYSAINNLGVKSASGEYLLFLNNDTEILKRGWMEDMLGYAMLPEVGAVGARLYYPDDTIQHAGVVLGFGEVAGHCFVQQKRDAEGYCRRIIIPQNYSAVTAACMMVPRDVFDKAGGFSEELAVAFNDVDLCLAIRKMGLYIVYDPYAELYHYESLTRGYEDSPEKQERFAGEIKRIRQKWPGAFDGSDPFYNPNLTRISQDFSLKRKSEEVDI